MAAAVALKAEVGTTPSVGTTCTTCMLQWRRAASLAAHCRAAVCGGHAPMATATTPWASPVSCWPLCDTTITGQAARPATCTLVDPTNMRSRPPMDRRPITSSAACSLSRISTSPGAPVTTSATTRSAGNPSAATRALTRSSTA